MNDSEAEQLGREIGEQTSKRMEILNQRYQECDIMGHKKPNTEKNICNYCYRNLIYKTPQANVIVQENLNQPEIFQTFNAPIVLEKMQQEIESKKSSDYLSGLTKIVKELNL